MLKFIPDMIGTKKLFVQEPEEFFRLGSHDALKTSRHDITPLDLLSTAPQGTCAGSSAGRLHLPARHIHLGLDGDQQHGPLQGVGQRF